MVKIVGHIDKDTEDKTQVAVYWNDEYIGQATEFTYVKGSKKVMPVLAIEGKLQIK